MSQMIYRNELSLRQNIIKNSFEYIKIRNLRECELNPHKMSFHIFLSTFKFSLGHLSLIAYYYKRFRGSQDMCTLVPFTHT